MTGCMQTLTTLLKHRTNMKCVQKCEGHYSDTEMGLFLDPEKYDKLERQRFGFAQFEVIVSTCASWAYL